MLNKMLKKNKRGFTLIELIVVIAIIAILAAVAAPLTINQIARAKYNNAADKANQIGTQYKGDVIDKDSVDYLEFKEAIKNVGKIVFVGANGALKADNGIYIKGDEPTGDDAKLIITTFYVVNDKEVCKASRQDGGTFKYEWDKDESKAVKKPAETDKSGSAS